MQNSTTGDIQLWLLNGQNLLSINQSVGNNPGLNWKVQTVTK
ncbi:MAG: hypothetical protein WCK98_02505 [bacterium]